LWADTSPETRRSKFVDREGGKFLGVDSCWNWEWGGTKEFESIDEGQGSRQELTRLSGVRIGWNEWFIGGK
jgi:hypothetical protein